MRKFWKQVSLRNHRNQFQTFKLLKQTKGSLNCTTMVFFIQQKQRQSRNVFGDAKEPVIKVPLNVMDGQPPHLIIHLLSQGIRSVPIFPINMWNCNKRVLSDEGRTNNSLESWHKVFANDAGDHPTVNKLVEQFRVEQKNTMILLAQLKSGDLYSKRVSSRDRDANIKEIVLLYGTITFEDFCDRLIPNL